jgi:hypothetical protein
MSHPFFSESSQSALDHIGARLLANTVVEVKYAGDRIVCSEYTLPESSNEGHDFLFP